MRVLFFDIGGAPPNDRVPKLLFEVLRADPIPRNGEYVFEGSKTYIVDRVIWFYSPKSSAPHVQIDMYEKPND